MPPDPHAIAASHDIVQILFWFIVVMAGGISGAVAWLAKYVVLPVKDAHIEYLKVNTASVVKVEQCLTSISQSTTQTADVALHSDRQRRLHEINHAQQELAAGQRTLG